MKTVLINLTDNAIKASEEGQTVEITGRHMENGYYFQVRDEGIGIPEEELHKITEAFIWWINPDPGLITERDWGLHCAPLFWNCITAA